jgi:hypothetical protein
VITADVASALLAAPRGRRLCLELSGVDPEGVLARLSATPPGSRQIIRWMDVASYPEVVLDRLALLVDSCWSDPERRPVLSAEELWSALDVAVAFATYWQPPDRDDEAAATSQLLSALAAVAEVVVADDLVAQWTRPLDPDRQLHVGWLDESGRNLTPALLTGVADRLRRLRLQARTGADLSMWWSAPAAYGLVTTTGVHGGRLPGGLVYVEDGQGWTRARVTPLRARRGSRVLELSGPDAWTALVQRHPLDVTASRGPAWRSATGLDGPWLVPDWAGVARTFDAVHLSTWGYLTTAGRALPLPHGHTLLAGWDPDATFWLTDCLAVAGPPSDWVRDPEDDGDAFGWCELTPPG